MNLIKKVTLLTLFLCLPIQAKEKKGHTLSSRGIASYHDYNKEDNKKFYYRYGRDMAAMVSLPCHSIVKVTNLRNNKSCIVTIADWGPRKNLGRLIDLNKSVFSKIGSVERGLMPVKITLIKRGTCKIHKHWV